jgi:hypothetical protein
LVLAAVAAVALSPFGRETLGSVRRGGLTLNHARHLLHVMTAVSLLVAAVAFLSLR